MKIETIRHSLAHIMALAVQELYPGVKFGIGPAIENGFYYDFDFSEIKIVNPKLQITNHKQILNSNDQNSKQEFKLTPENLPKIEKKMKELIRQDIKFKKKFISKAEGKKLFKNQPYKVELIEEKSKVKSQKSKLQVKSQKLSIYQVDNFIDLCQGPHIKSTKDIHSGSFKLTKIAGAYWKGDEKNKMLTRIYSIALKTKNDLDDYLAWQKEAEKRDHRILGQKLDLFHIDENVGPGLILWHPKGAILKKIIEDYALKEYLNNGYQLVNTPHIAKIKIWETSGHTDFYKENMFPRMKLSEMTGIEEKNDYQIKPMNCPFHIFIYKQKIKSYKDLPIRYTEIGTVYRYEKSGTLHGLVRVRVITQDDAHIFCAPNQLEKELVITLSLVKKILKTFGFKNYQIFLSTRPEKYVGNLKIWKKATDSLKFALKKSKLDYKIDPGEGVFYGPKIDIKIKDSIGRLWQCTTIQVDFNLPEKFEMSYVDEKGEKQQPIMIHRALLGSLERFIGVLIEHYAGAFPLWLAPEQIWIIPISDKHKKYAQEIKEALRDLRGPSASEGPLRSLSLRVQMKDENETLGKKIREGEMQKIPYLLIIGDKEIKTKSVSVRERNKGDIGAMKLIKFLEKIQINNI